MMSSLSDKFRAAREAAQARTSASVLNGEPAQSSRPAPLSKIAAALSAAGVETVPGATPPHVIVVARAGTGKTTTLVEGLKLVKGVPTNITPSPQQAAVWETMRLSSDAHSIGFCAFNKSIADELRGRVPKGCDAMTMHGLGYRAVLKQFPFLGGGKKPNEYRVQEIMEVLMGTDIREFRKRYPVVVKATEKLVALCKQNLVPLDCGDWGEELDKLASHYEVELRTENGKDYRDVVFEIVPSVLQACADPNTDRCIDFNDMIWLPVVLDLPVQKFDLLLVDECQDLNRCQQELAMKAGRRLILCGDPRQAIYGFAGADAQSMTRMEEKLRAAGGVIVLPLNMTRRCGRRIVAEANEIVPDFYAHETCPEGEVTCAAYPIQGGHSGMERVELPWERTYCAQVKPGDMVLCRVNAPLVSQCFRFLKHGVKATIRGRDIASNLIATVEKLGVGTVVELVGKVTDWVDREVKKEQAKRTPNEAAIIAVQDRGDCILAFCEGMETVAQVIAGINSVFSDERGGSGVVLSSVHKAKGLEASTVFILVPRGASMPHPSARSPWQVEQELNLRYVAITRAIHKLVWVS